MDKPPKSIAGAELAELIKKAREDFMMRTELFAVIAAETKAKFDAYVAVGFTGEQALRLCMDKPT